MKFNTETVLSSRMKDALHSTLYKLYLNYPKGVFYWDSQEDQIWVNHRFQKLLLLQDITISREDFLKYLEPSAKHIFSNNGTTLKTTIDIFPPTRIGGDRAKLSLFLQPVEDAQNQRIGILGIEYTDDKFPLERVFNIANQFQQVALRTRQRKKILQAICDLLVEEGKFLLAWIGEAQPRKNRVVPICWSGKGDYLESIRITLDDSPTGKGPTAIAVKTQRMFICRDTENDPAFAPWREQALARGFLSTLAFPFRDELDNILTLNLYAHEKFHFDENEIQLIEHLVNDLIFALEVLHKRKALQQSLRNLEKEHWKTTQFLSTSLDGFLLIDQKGIIRDVNPAYCSISGYTFPELIGKPLNMLEFSSELPEIQQKLKSWFQHKQGRYTTTHRTKTGDPLQLEVSYCTIESGRKKYIASFIRNITPEKKLIKQLEKSERQYRELVENSPFIYGILHNDHIVYINKTGEETFQRILGEPVLGKHKKFFLSAEEYQKSLERMEKIQAGETVNYPVELQFTDREGKIWYFELYIIYADIQDPHNVHFLLSNITERKKSQEALLRKDRILEAVGFAATEFLNNDFEHADIQRVLGYLGEATHADRVYIFRNHQDDAGNLLTSQLFEWVNDGIEPFIDSPELQNIHYEESGFGRWVQELSQGNLIMGNIEDFPASERPFLEAQDIKSILVMPIFAGNIWWGFVGFDNCTSQFLWSSAEIETLRVAANLIGASLNRMNIEKERNLLAQALKNINDGVVITDLNRSIVYANNAFLQIFGYSENTITGQPLSFLFDEENMSIGVEEIFQNTLDKGWQGEVYCKRKDGTPFTAYLSTSVLKDAGGNATSLIFILRDISEYKLLQRQLQQAQKMEAIGRLAGGVAHDFNNLLTVITGYSQLLLAQIPEDSPYHSELKQIYAAGERASELTNQLLAFSRQQMVTPKVYAINALVTEMEKMIRRLIGEDIKVTTRLQKNAGNIRTDRGQFQQILLNLVINARDAMPNGGELILETGQIRVDDAFIQRHPGARKGVFSYLRVRDTGIGIPEKHLSRIFEPFFTTKAKGKGTGLGLATVYGIVKQNKGYIWVESQVGKGTTFDVLFPLVNEAESHETEKSPRLPALVSESNKTILIVEDDNWVRQLVRNILASAGYTIQEAHNGEEALVLLQQHYPNIHLVITDIIMPEMSGFELGKHIERHYPGVKVLYMSGYSEELTKNNDRRLTTANFLKKPFTPADLLNKIKTLLKQVSV